MQKVTHDLVFPPSSGTKPLLLPFLHLCSVFLSSTYQLDRNKYPGHLGSRPEFPFPASSKVVSRLCEDDLSFGRALFFSPSRAGWLVRSQRWAVGKK